jgi:HopA1 effector protein family
VGPHRYLLAQALNEIAVISVSRFSWLGYSFQRPASRSEEAESTKWLRLSLEERLYADFYCTGGIVPPSFDTDRRRGSWMRASQESLSHANAGRGHRLSLPVRDHDTTGQAVVEYAGLAVWVDADPGSNALTPGPPRSIDVTFPKEIRGLPSGFYTAIGDSGPPLPSIGGGADRYYWNVRPHGRAALVAALTKALNREKVPFRLKVANDAQPARCDAGVLYVDRSRRFGVLSLLEDVVPEVRRTLRPRVPAFTFLLAPGVGFAEDPPGDESFGIHRSRLVAGALVQCSGTEKTDARTLVQAIEAAFDDLGLSLDRPFLNPGADPGTLRAIS